MSDDFPPMQRLKSLAQATGGLQIMGDNWKEHLTDEERERVRVAEQCDQERWDKGQVVANMPWHPHTAHAIANDPQTTIATLREVARLRADLDELRAAFEAISGRWNFCPLCGGEIAGCYGGCSLAKAIGGGG